MRNLLAIKPLHFNENNCYEDQIATITNWWNQGSEENILFCYTDSWEFAYDTQTGNSKQPIGEKFSREREYNFLTPLLAPLRKYYGVQLNFKKSLSFKELLASIEAEIRLCKPVILDMNSSYIPWDELYGNYGTRHAHVFIIVGIDNVNKEFIATDGYYLKQNVKISFENVLMGFNGEHFTFDFYSDFVNFDTIDWRVVLNNIDEKLSNNSSGGFNEKIRKFAEDVEILLDFNHEIEESNGNIVYSKFYIGIADAMHGRAKFAKVLRNLYKIHNISLLNVFSCQMDTAVTKWNKILHMFVKASFMNESLKLKETIVNEIKLIADYELNIYNRMINSLKMPDLSTAEQELEYKMTAPFTHLEYINLSELFNSTSFGTISDECSANIISDLMLPRAYFLEDEAPGNEIIEIDNMKFKFPAIGDNLFDNISCAGQEIYLSSDTVDNIMFLGCAEWGDFVEELTIVFNDDSSKKIEITLTDWYKNPIFGEKIALKHKAVCTNQQGLLEISRVDFHLFAKSYSINSLNRIKKIILPFCPNMHIYAVSLGTNSNN